MSKKVILIVEDNDDSREAMTAMIESFGHEVRAYPEASSALNDLKEDELNGRKIDLALLDIMLPGMNGYELLTEIKKLPFYSSLHCIMVTAKDADSEVIEGYKFGADYYITKPFTSKQLKYGIELYL